MNRHGFALGLLQAVAEGGATLEPVRGGLDLVGDLPEALSARLATFCDPPALDDFDATATRVHRAMQGAKPADGCDTSVVDDAFLRRVRDAGSLYRALRDVVAAPSLAAREILTLPVAFAVGLPHPFSVVFRRGAQLCIATTSREAHAQALAAGAAVFVLRELEAAALAVELERATPADLDRWIAAKLRGDWRLTPELALGIHRLCVDQQVPTVSFGDFFDVLGAELVDVVLHEATQSKGAA